MAAIIDEATREQDWETHSEQPASKLIRSMSLGDIANDLEASIDDLKAFLEEHNATLIDFQGAILVPENEAVAAYEHYSVIRARQKMHERFSQQQTNSDRSHSDSNHSDSNSSNNKQKRTYLTWKGPFKVNRTSYQRTLQTALNALFPNSEEEQKTALEGIRDRTDLGKAIVDKISRDSAYVNRDAAREKLFEAAGQLILTETETTESEEEVA